MRFFALDRSETLGRAMAGAGGFPLSHHEDRAFEDGERKTRPLDPVRGEDVFILSSLHRDEGLSVAEKLCRLLFFIAACKENGAARVTAITPYLCYARKDRQTKPQDPVTSKYVARLFEAAGADAVVTVDVHNLAAFQNAFRCPVLHLSARGLFVDAVRAATGGEAVTIVSPDAGGVKRAELLREALAAATDQAVGLGFMEKRRSGGVVSGAIFAGEVEGRHVFILDDMIVGGGTMERAAAACVAHGAASVRLMATHALFSAGAAQTLATGPATAILATDSVPLREPDREALGPRLTILPLGPLLGQTVAALAGGGARGLPQMP